ncbi:MAG TPA: ethylbenzene dehydrogenase-related protein, partial [Acidobacteriota bacterium]
TIHQVAGSEKERQEMIWGLIYYVKSLETGAGKSQTAGGSVISKNVPQIKGSDVMNPFGAQWNQAPETSFPLSRLWQRGSSNSAEVKVRSLYNDDFVAVMLEWDDASQQASSYAVQEFQDAAAVQFSLTGTPGFHGMGGKANPCNLWFWRSEWQFRSDTRTESDIAKKYPQRAIDSNVKTYPQEIQDEARLAGRDAGNLVSQQTVRSPIEDMNALGPGTLTSQPAQQQNVNGKGQWNGKVWRVVFVRGRKSADRGGDIQFKAGKSYPLAFAVWNGSERDRNGQKLVSTWYSLELKK